MKPNTMRWWLVPSVLVVLAPPAAYAQTPTQTVDSHSSCFRTSSVRAAAGGALGAWLGFVAAKIQVSDWNDAARGPEAQRTRNRYTIGGAVLGLAAGGLLRLGGECGNATPALAMPTAPVNGMDRPITLEEITQSGVTGSVYDVVFALRRPWLNLRGVDGLSGDGDTMKLYLDNVRLGDVEQLRTMSVEHVLSITHYSGPDATYRWGAGNVHGAIEVRTAAP